MNCRTSVAHFDSPAIVDIGLTQMLSLVVDGNPSAALDVFLSNLMFNNVDIRFTGVCIC